MLSKKNTGSGKGTITPQSAAKIEPAEPTESSSAAKATAENAVARSVTEKHESIKDEPTPSAESAARSLKTEGKDSAPIFALFHGKIVPLGKLPDTSFKKSHTEARNEESHEKEDSHAEESHVMEDRENGQAKSEVKLPENRAEHNAESRVERPEERHEVKHDETSNSLSSAESDKRDKAKSLSPSQFTRLSSYFHNLDSKNRAAVETRMIKSRKKDVTGTAKDEVPELPPSMKNSEFLKHVKGIVLDDGKMVTLKGKQSEQAETQVC